MDASIVNDAITAVDGVLQRASDTTQAPKWAVAAGAAALATLLGAATLSRSKRLSMGEGLVVVITGCDT
ncbi:hypothetical protein HDU93_007649, partial [Gonapodya sp. JEL0774]